MEEAKKTTVTKNKTAKVETKSGKSYSYKYVDIAQIHDYLEVINARYIQIIKRIDGDDYVFTKRCFNDTWEDEWLQGARVVDATLFGTDNPAQKQGSALTYARRYSLLMAFGLATEDDDAQSLTRPTITSVEEAKAYKLTFGKYADKTLGEVPDDYLQWLFEYTKDENIRTACDYLLKHVTQKDVDMIAKLNNLIVDTETDYDSLVGYYGVSSIKEMNTKQLEEAVKHLEDKLKNKNNE